QVLLKLGEQTTVGSYTLRNDGVKVDDDGQKQMFTAYVTVFRGGKEIDKMYPAKWSFHKHEDTPTTETAIRRSFSEDLYLVYSMDKDHLKTQSASLQIVINPLVDWVWLGFGVLALGTGIALLPERAYSFALAKMPAEVPAAIGLILVLLFSSGSTLLAQ